MSKIKKTDPCEKCPYKDNCNLSCMVQYGDWDDGVGYAS